jgi:hypothetical protein
VTSEDGLLHIQGMEELGDGAKSDIVVGIHGDHNMISLSFPLQDSFVEIIQNILSRLGGAFAATEGATMLLTDGAGPFGITGAVGCDDAGTTVLFAENGLVLRSVTTEVTSGLRLYPGSYEFRVT